MVWAERGAQEPVSCLGHELSPTRLGGEAMPTLDILVDLLSKVLFDNGNLAVMLQVLRIGLDRLEILHQHIQGPVLGVGHEKSQIDEMVGVCEVTQVREEH